MADNLVSPVGRIVQGSPCVGNNKDINGNPRTDKNGNPINQYFVKLAVEKSNPDFIQTWNEILNTARSAFPAYAGAIDQLIASNATPDVILAQLGNNITFRVQDGDSPLPDKNGRPWNQKEGFAGHWILHFSTCFAPQLVLQDPTQIVTEEQAVTFFKRGNYCRIVTSLNTDHNQGCNIYMNMQIVQFMGYGQEITSGPDASALLGGDTAPVPNIPAAMQTVPIAPTGVPAAPMPGQAVPAAPMPGQAVPAAPMPGQAVPAAPMPGQAVPAAPMPGQAAPMPGQAVPAAPMPGQAVPAAPMPGQAVPAAPMPGQAVPAAPMPGQAAPMPGQAVPAAPMPGQAVPAAPMPGQAVPAAPMPGQAAPMPGQAVPAAPMPGQAVPAAPMPGQAVPAAPMPGQAVQPNPAFLNAPDPNQPV